MLSNDPSFKIKGIVFFKYSGGAIIIQLKEFNCGLCNGVGWWVIEFYGIRKVQKKRENVQLNSLFHFGFLFTLYVQIRNYLKNRVNFVCKRVFFVCSSREMERIWKIKERMRLERERVICNI